MKYSVGEPKEIDCVFFDMDGVITNTISSWKHIHDYFHTSNERSVDAYLRGKIDDLEFIKRDISLWKQNGVFTTKQTLEKILFNIPMMKGAHELFSYLQKQNVTTVIVSAGLDLLAEKVANELPIDFVLANGVKTDKHGRLTGEGVLRVQLMYKDKTVQGFAKTHKIRLDHCAAVGNSCFDVPMFETCGLGIAFNPDDECVREAADVVIEDSDLTQLIPVLKPYLNSY
jgi:phosphoserine phosphatase